MPASDWNAVPPGSTCASADGQCVCVPITADTWPSRKCANAIFSLDASAWKSTRIAATVPPSRCRASRFGRDAERAVERVHVEPPHRLQHQRPPPARHLHHHRTATRRARRIVQRTEQPGGLGDVGNDLLAVPGVVAQRDHVGAGGEQRGRHVGSEAEPVRGVLGVHHGEVDAQRRRSLGSDVATASRPVRPTTSPMNRMRIHLSLQKITPRSVATASSRSS